MLRLLLRLFSTLIPIIAREIIDHSELIAYDPIKCRSNEYRGKMNVAFDGTECLDWIDHKSFYIPYWTEDQARQNKNYCRNPANDSTGPWCVVSLGRFKYCDVPRCAEHVGCYNGNGEDYYGEQDQINGGHPCAKWRSSSTYRDLHSSYRFRLQLNKTHSKLLSLTDPELDNFRACRNPSGIKSRPWCYVSQEVGVSNGIQYCDIPKCSEASTLGYPLFINGSQCARNFIKQKQIVKQHSSNMIELQYCVAQLSFVYKRHEDKNFSKFKQFCLFLVGKTTFCPIGFVRTRRFQPSLEYIGHVSGPTAWRPTFDNVLRIITCCAQTDYWKNFTVKPYISVEKISSHKREHSVDDFWNEVVYRQPKRRHSIKGPFSNTRVSTIRVKRSSTLSSEPLFVSISHCPPVEGTTRIVAPLFRNMIPDETFGDVLQNLFPEISCEYREVNENEDDVEENKKNDKDGQVALLVNEPNCPAGFTKIQLSRRVLFILGTSISLCWPNKTIKSDRSLNQFPIGDYCMITGHTLDESKTDYSTEIDSESRSVGDCPPGFRLNQINFMTLNYRLHLCCGNGNNSNENINSQNFQAPFGTRSPFAVIQNSRICPTFYAGEVKLSLVQYSRPIPRPYRDQIELSGMDNPVKLDGVPNIVMCQYLNPETKIGVKALRYDCEGLGHRTSLSYSGATCGFEINSTQIFPPGRYCLLRLSSTCPSGFTSPSGVVRLGFSLQTMVDTCCRTEESIGAIKLPVRLEAPFKLPAIHRPCQAIEGFNVDAELQQCVYYPKTSQPQILLVWPRIISVSNDSTTNISSVPKHCSMMPKKRKGIPRNQLARLSKLFFSIMQDQWLTYKRPRWIRNTDSGEICFGEVYSQSLPTKLHYELEYCIPAFGSCPEKYFQTIGSSPYMNTVICCTTSDYPNNFDHEHYPMRSFVTFGRATLEDKKKLNKFIGSKILYIENEANEQSNENATQQSCPQFINLKLKRRVVESLEISPTTTNKMKFNDDNKLYHLASLFNNTKLDEKQFEALTGIWWQNQVVHIIYCEYGSNKAQNEDDGKNWPVANYALPKSLNDCPKGSVKSTISHHQDRYGFHYSQPIHLDGTYVKRKKDIILEYCVFTDDHNAYASGNYGAAESLPAGHYCVLRVNGHCPSDFREGLLSILEGPDKSEPIKSGTEISSESASSIHTGISPDIIRIRSHMKQSGSKIDRLNYHFCCRTDSPSVDNPIDGFPSEFGPFYLYRVGDKCQQVANMRVTEEFICLDAPNRADSNWWALDRNQTWSPYTVKGLTPARIPYHDYCDVEINLCYYEPVPASSDSDTTESYDFQTEWPIGQYGLPNVHRSNLDKACPPGFIQRYRSLINQQTVFFELELMPMSLGPYFLELIGHNYSALNVHYCERDNNNNVIQDNITEQSNSKNDDSNIVGSTEKNLTTPIYLPSESQWPRGDYCVISTSESWHCPPGLHRHSRAISELCCRTDNIKDPKPVNWPFTEDFFLFGGEKCLPILNTHVERYLVRLVSATETKHEQQWDVLCHYLPASWMNTTIRWPSGEYMLPIGRRSGLRSSLVTTVAHDDLSGSNAAKNHFVNQSGQYECPETFNRARFTFVSTDTEQQSFTNSETRTETTYNVTATVIMEFCVHMKNLSDQNESVEWPVGDYCIFTMNQNCPIGMQASKEVPLKISRFLLKSIQYVTKNGQPISDSHWHQDAENHIVYFMQCCREDKHLLLRLPPSKDGFYLASSSGLCSTVPGTVLDREKMTTYFTSPLANNRKSAILNERDLLLYRELVAQREGLLYLCYYHPAQGLDYTTTILGTRYSASQNISEIDVDNIAKLCGCAKNAFCLLNKQAECICKPGYFGDGRYICKPVTPLTDECADLCDPSAFCAEHLDANLKKKQLLSHICVCRPGFVGDGFTCRPDCMARECQPFSRCIHNIPRGITECICIEGTVLSGTRCHLDVYKTIEQEKDLPQFIIDHDHCLSEKTQNSLRLLNPPKFFYIFSPPHMIQSCQDVNEHVVVRNNPLTINELKSATTDSPFKLITENNTVIEIYLKNETWFIDGFISQIEPAKFVNGELYYLSAPLKREKYVYRLAVYKIVLIILFLIIVVFLTTFVGCKYGKRYKNSFRRIQPLPRQLLFRRAFWKQQGEDVLVEETDDK